MRDEGGTVGTKGGAARAAGRSGDPASLPVHRAEDILEGGAEARILLADQVYVLRLTRAGKLILTK
jgi:hemin uptake protein HemP